MHCKAEVVCVWACGCLVPEEDFLVVDILLGELAHSLPRVLSIQQLPMGGGPAGGGGGEEGAPGGGGGGGNKPPHPQNGEAKGESFGYQIYFIVK